MDGGKINKMNTLCPCNTIKNYADCCQKYIEGKVFPAIPSELMRSRYTAFVLADLSYIANTMKGPALAHFNPEETLAWLKEIEWEGLTVISERLKTPKTGFVSFEARFWQQGRLQYIREKSEFHKINGRWFYVEGTALPHKASKR